MVTVTQAVLAAAGEQGDKAAVIDAADGRCVTYAELADFVPRAAAGLARRGLRSGDVAAVLLTSARDYILAVHALNAAGVVPAPLDAELGTDALTERLIDCDARVLVTAESLAAPALAAVEGSYVRQVFAFGEVPSATSFDELLDGEPVPDGAADPSAALLLCDEPGGPVALTHAERVDDLRRILAAGDCTASDVVVVTVSGRSSRFRADILDATLIRGGTLIAVCEPGAAAFLRAVRDHRPTAAFIGPERPESERWEPLRFVTIEGEPPEVPFQSRRRSAGRHIRAMDLYSR
jgi:acyl-CoA synthetase (AMP-forming)/AMP-acid ligase II